MQKLKIPYNKPYLTGKETYYIKEAVEKGKLSGNGYFTKKCQKFFESTYGFGKCLLTSSCTDALEMAAILCNIEEGDEVIMPSYTFVSSANAFVLRGAKIVFADSHIDHPGIDESSIEHLITKRTKAIVVVHYAGIACNMDVIMDLAEEHNIFVVEDAAQAIDSYYTGRNGEKRPLGSIGHFAAFSFHETKNIISGEGGMLVINDKKYCDRAEIIWEKGTNRSAFFRGEVNKYGWVDIGSSFLPSEITAAFLWAQLENLRDIQNTRLKIWTSYKEKLSIYEKTYNFRTPYIPSYSTNNAHLFYILLDNIEIRDRIISKLKEHGILSVFHYLSLHKSDFYKSQYKGEDLNNSDLYTDCLLRLPLYYELQLEDVDRICSLILSFFKNQ